MTVFHRLLGMGGNVPCNPGAQRWVRPHSEALLLLVAFTSAMLLAGCSALQDVRPSQRLNVPKEQLADIGRPDAFNETDNPSDFVSVGGRSDFVLQPMNGRNDPLPDFMVKPFMFDGVSVYDVLQGMLDQSGQRIAVSMEVPEEQRKKGRRVVSSFYAEGKFAQVIERLSRISGFFFRYKDGVLSVVPDAQFIASLPPVQELFDAVPMMVGKLGATDVLLDRTSRLLTFRADQASFGRVESYLMHIRRTRSLLTYDCYVWEVQLNDESSMGIRWRDLPTSSINAAAGGAEATFKNGNAAGSLSFGDAGALSGGGGVGFVFKASRFAMSSLIEFLKSQGTLNNISQPRLSVLSGGIAQFRNGVNIPYVSKVAPGTLINGAWIAGSAETATLQTGLTMTIAGDFSDGTVFSDVALRLQDLVRTDKQQVAVSQGVSTTISMPVVADREVTAKVRSKPGDAIIVGGINMQRLNNETSGFGAANTSASKRAERSELVVILVPRITHFVRNNDRDPSGEKS